MCIPCCPIREMGSYSVGVRHNALTLEDDLPKLRIRVLPDRLRNVAWRQVAVVTLDHPRVGMTEIASNHQKRHSAHHRQACPGVTQRVKVQRRLDAGALACLSYERGLATCLPFVPEQQRGARSTGSQLTEERSALIAENDVPIFVCLGLADMQRAGVGVEVRHTQPRQLLIASPSLESRLHKNSEVTLRRVD